jgi:hypothetical protein
MYRHLRDVLRTNALVRSLMLYASLTMLFGLVAGYLLGRPLVQSAAVAGATGIVFGGALTAAYGLSRAVRLPRFVCSFLLIALSVLSAPIASGFIIAHASGHTSGTDTVAVVGGLMALSPLVMAVIYGLIAYHYSRVRCG